MIKDNGADTPPLQVVTDCLSEQARDILMRLFRQHPELFPDLFLNPGTDFDCGHANSVVDMA